MSFFLFVRMLNFSNAIINWYLVNKRELPWREITDPYKIWVSEIILQQTRIAQGLDYYLRFIERFPTVRDLAFASEDEVLLQWQGLGYYSRARNMHTAAKSIIENFNGIFPSSYESIRSLKGVGDYTAAAIASFAFNLPYAVLDGNVFRVLSRYFEINTPIDSTAGKKQFALLAQELLDPKRPALFNQGLMDLGAVICQPITPNCSDCPLSDSCAAFVHHHPTDFPVKAKKTAVRNRYFVYFVIEDNGIFFLHKRSEKDIWQGLYEFPLVEIDHPFEISDWNQLITQLSPEFSSIQLQKIHPVIKHVLSHQTIFAQFITATATYKKKNDSQYLAVPESQLSDFAVSRLTELFLESIH